MNSAVARGEPLNGSSKSETKTRSGSFSHNSDGQPSDLVLCGKSRTVRIWCLAAQG